MAPREGDQAVHRCGIIFMPMFIAALIADTFTAAVGTLAVGQIKDLLHRGIPHRVHGRGAKFFGQRQPVGMGYPAPVMRL